MTTLDLLTPDRLTLQRDHCALLVIDIQSRLCKAMNPDWLRRMRRNARTLVAGARIMGLPVIVTEQYPKGLGPTVPDVMEVLPEGQPILEKMSFSCCGEPTFLESLIALRRDQILVTGMETHVCVFQTVRDLLARSLVRSVFVAEDATVSRTRRNHEIGLRQMAHAGAVRTSVEAALFDLLDRADTPEFKAVSALIQ